MSKKKTVTGEKPASTAPGPSKRTESTESEPRQPATAPVTSVREERRSSKSKEAHDKGHSRRKSRSEQPPIDLKEKRNAARDQQKKLEELRDQVKYHQEKRQTTLQRRQRLMVSLHLILSM